MFDPAKKSLSPMPIKLFDSYKRELVEINNTNTVEPGTIKIYSCGPTVYNYQSIGNMRAVWLPDTMAKIAKLSGWNVEWVSNITDVGHLTDDGDDGEDKLEKGAKRENKKVQDIVNFYTQDFYKQCKALNFDLPTGRMNPKATDYIKEQMVLALTLLKENKAYLTEDGIYFDSLANSGAGAETDSTENANENIEKQENYTGRSIVQTGKKNPNDFALWKFVSENSLQKWQFKDFEDATRKLVIEYFQKATPQKYKFPDKVHRKKTIIEKILDVPKVVGLIKEDDEYWSKYEFTSEYMEFMKKYEKILPESSLRIEDLYDIDDEIREKKLDKLGNADYHYVESLLSDKWGCPGWHSECVAMICALLRTKYNQEK